MRVINYNPRKARLYIKENEYQIFKKNSSIGIFDLLVVKKRGKMTAVMTKYIDRLLPVPEQSF